MPSCQFVGYRYVDYISKTGKPVKGYNIYLNEERAHVTGCVAFDVWISCELFEECFAALSIGDSVCLNYNRYGNVVGAYKV